MLEQALLLLLGELALGSARGVLDLVFGHPDTHRLARGLCAGERHEMRLGAKQAAADQRPFRLCGLLILVDVLHRANLFSISSDQIAALPGVCVSHWCHVN